MEARSVSAVCDDVLGTADAVEIARRIRDKEIRPQEAVDAAIARAERVNPSLNAIAFACFDSAREEAGRPRSGVFAGVPSFIKDNEAVLGTPLLHGSRGLPKLPSAESSPFVEQFLSLGLINLGKTT
ncbi:MAG: amidase family protein, partial [Polyangiales bacterium]